MLSTYQGVKERELLLPPLLLHTQELKNKFQKLPQISYNLANLWQQPETDPVLLTSVV